MLCTPRKSLYRPCQRVSLSMFVQSRLHEEGPGAALREVGPGTPGCHLRQLPLRMGRLADHFKNI